MFSGVKFIPRGQAEDAECGSDVDSPLKSREKFRRKDKYEKRKKKTHHDSSDDNLEKLKSRSRHKKSWYSSEASSSSSDSEDESSSFKSEGSDDKKRKRSKRGKQKQRERKSQIDVSSKESNGRLKRKSKGKKKEYSSGTSLSDSESGGHNFSGEEAKHQRRWQTHGHNECRDSTGEDVDQVNMENSRKEVGLEWMLRTAHKQGVQQPVEQINAEEEPIPQEVKKLNPKELNPYLKDNGSGYPEETSAVELDQNQFSSAPVFGDGGASWRLKALKRAQEQAAREGRKLDEVVGERWGSLGLMTLSIARNKAAPTHAHLRAIKDRKKGYIESDKQYVDADQMEGIDDKVQSAKRDYLKGISVRNQDMKEPKAHGSLLWRKKKDLDKSEGHAELISSAALGLNKFTNDGSFLQSFNLQLQKDAEDIAVTLTPTIDIVESENRGPQFLSANSNDNGKDNSSKNQAMSANHSAAKVLQLRMKGKHEEAEKLLKESERMTEMEKKAENNFVMDNTSRSGLAHTSIRQKKAEENVDKHLAMKIMQNKQYKLSEQADDEYDYDDVSTTKQKKKRSAHYLIKHENVNKRILTQQERCQFCFENPSRPKHLVVSIGNLSYLMLPPWKPVVEGHCCILPLQHESSTRNLDDDVWDEVRNFKKCLLKMFAKQEKDVIFLETAMALSQQRRHCLVECIPLPHAIAKDAPLYFKKAIDEAEDEWSQHNAKKLIDTSLKGGLRNSIPKNFPYFHVEFGLLRGFVHVIDDEKHFKSSLGLDVIRGMLQLPEEDMHRRRQYGSLEMQKNDVLRFSRDWARFDWTRELD